MTLPVFGKYRGTVANNVDRRRQGRLQVRVPAVLGDEVIWALPSVPYAGLGVGFLAVPPLAANVWVEFEGGDLESPIWTGCFWGEGELPRPAGQPGVHLLKTEAITLTLTDLEDQGGFLLEVGPPAVRQSLVLVVNAQGIVLATESASLKLSAEEIDLTLGQFSVKVGPTGVSINDGALEVT